MTTCWSVREKDFPAAGTPDQQLRFALQYAILAPSSHNSQPWRFYQNGASVTFVADRTRGLSVVDPYDRELVIGCGAAIMNVCVALAHFGRGFDLTAFPAEAESDVVAILHLQDRRPMAALAELFPAVCRRVTNREAFEDMPVAAAEIDSLRRESSAEGVSLSAVVSDAQRCMIANLVAEADMIQLADHRFRRELASWMHPSRAADGLPRYAGALADLPDSNRPPENLSVRTFDTGGGVAARDAALVRGSPLLLCFSTAGDTQEDWLFAGQALGRVLLRANLAGLDASFLNQPVQVPALRHRLARVIGVCGNPQLLIRMGRRRSLPHTPRRPAGEVVF